MATVIDRGNASSLYSDIIPNTIASGPEGLEEFALMCPVFNLSDLDGNVNGLEALPLPTTSELAVLIFKT